MKRFKANVRFTGKDDGGFFLTVKRRVDEYFRKNEISPNANSEMIVKSIVLLSAYIFPFVVILLFNPPFIISIFLWLIMGFALAGNGMSVMHDANHGAYSGSDRVNNMMGLTLNLLGGCAFNWKLQHNLLHHTYTNISGMDEDIDNKVVLRFSPHGKLKKSHRHQVFFAFFFYSIMTLYWGVAKDAIQYFSYTRRGVNTNSKAQNIFLLIRISLFKIIYFFTFLVVPTLFFDIPFYQILLGFLLMHLTAGLILSIVFQLAHTVEGTSHPLPDNDGNIENAWAIHQLHTTKNFAQTNRLLSWYVGGLNFQVEHHLFPRTCHVHYPQIAPIVKQTAEEFGIPYLENRTFMQAFRSHMRTLKKFGRTPIDEIIG